MEEISSMTFRSSELSFNKEDFTAKDFSVERFVSEYRKQVALETLKEDLGLFLKVLQSAMVELINKDYADFVNLSTNLVGLDKSINNLRIPIEQVKTELTNFCILLDNTVDRLQDLIKEKNEIHLKKTQLYSVICVLEGIDNIEKQNLKPVDKNCNESQSCEFLERIAVELKRIQFHISLITNVQIINERQSLIKDFSNNLLQHLELTFLQSLTDSNQEVLFKVLHIYSLIDKTEEVENKFRIKIVRPYMRDVIHETVIGNEGINNMYNRVLDFIPNKCSLILNVIHSEKKDVESLKAYDFLVNAIWPEIVICLEYISTSVFAPGNPVLFHKNFTASMLFLEKFESLCLTQTSVKKLRTHPSFESFMKKWDINVYFDIRFQEIGSSFENALLFSFKECEGNPYHLNIIHVLWKCITSCWDDNVYISSLCSEFWKLTFQILSRCYIWLMKTTKEANTDDYLDDPVFQDVTLIRDETRVSVISLIFLVIDIELFLQEMQQYFQLVILTKLTIKEDIFYNSLKQQMEVYSHLPENIGKVIVKRLTSQCSQHLKLITDIPRLYRKTNRDVPSKPSSYVSMIFAPLDVIILRINSTVSSGWKSEWTNAIIDQVIQQCHHMITEVITSVKKMEDSLKRLKKARDKPLGNISSGTMSDDDKIRHQLIIDVQTIGTLIKKYQTKKYNENYIKLEELVHSTVKIVKS